MKKKPKVVSLFTGCGGSDLGLHQAGYDVVMANDILPYARDVYLNNLPETDYRLGDIRDISAFPDSEVLVGCYPCQGFSQGGARQSSRVVNFLYREFVRALRAIKPKAFIVENVSGMQRADFRHLLESQLRQFRLSGYKVRYEILDASDYGVPQERRRLIFVGLRSDLGEAFTFPSATHGNETENKKITIGKAIGQMPLWPEGEYWAEPFHWYYLSRNRYRNWDELAKTIVSHPRHMPLHPVSPKLERIHTDKWVWENDLPARRYSFRESAVLQGFPRNLNFPENQKGTLRMKYTVIGNAVPPPLFKEIGRALLEYL